MRLHLLLGLLAFVLLALPAASASADPRVCVYVDDSHPPLFTGHTFVQLLPDSGPQAGSKNLVYGFSPYYSWWFIDGYGQVTSNAQHHWDFKICYDTAQRQYEAMAQQIQRDITKPPDYDLFKFNCTDWAGNLVRANGIRLPDYRERGGRFTNVSDPVALKRSLLEIGINNTFKGGTVSKNTGNVLPNALHRDKVNATELDASSYVGLVEFALDNPDRLADGLRLRREERQLPRLRIGNDDAVKVEFDDVTDGRAIVVVDWGDGDTTLQDIDSSHRYNRNGEYRVRAVVIRNATLFRANFTARVGGDEGGESIELNVPQAGPRQDFPDPPAATPPLFR